MFTPKLSLGLATRPVSAPLVICWSRSQASGLAYGVAASCGTSAVAPARGRGVITGRGDAEHRHRGRIGIVLAEELPCTIRLLVGGEEREPALDRRVAQSGAAPDERLHRERGAVGIDVVEARVASEVPTAVGLLRVADLRDVVGARAPQANCWARVR